MNYSYQNTEIIQYEHDISKKHYNQAIKAKIVAWDIETSGLDWQFDNIGTCQLYIPDNFVVIVKIDNKHPERLNLLLSNNKVKKVFHHAMFDLRFMSYEWNVTPRNIACTKIASKLLGKSKGDKHTLKHLLNYHLGVTIDKSEALSNWFDSQLTKQQVLYAAKDVLYLPRLLNELEKKLKSKNLLELANSCFAYIPTMVQLDILGYKDIYRY